MARTPYLGERGGASGGRTPYLGGSKSGGGFLGAVAKYSGADLAGNFAKDVGDAALGAFPGLVHTGGAIIEEAKHGHTGLISGHPNRGAIGQKIVEPVAHQYADYYGHDLFHHLYKHPLQPTLDLLTILDLGATAGVRAGLLSGERATIVTRSPKAVATGKGPVAKDLTSTKPLVRGRQMFGAKLRTTEGVKIPATNVRVGGEMKSFGKHIAEYAGQAALGRLNFYKPFQAATHRLKPDEWAALHIRATGVHPHDLAAIWKPGTVAGDVLRDPKVEKLVLKPSTRMLKAEPEAQTLSAVGAGLYQQTGRLSEEAGLARPDLVRRQVADALGYGSKRFAPTPDAGVPDDLALRLMTPDGPPGVSSATGDRFTHFYSRDAQGKPQGILTVFQNTAGDPTHLAIFVKPSARRTGVATSLYNEASKQLDISKVMGAESLTDEGAKFLNAYATPKPRTIPGGPDAYYFPHTVEPSTATASPFAMAGGGKGVPRVPGSTKQNLGILSLQGKLHLRGDILGPEFLRRVKFVKYSEIHNALVRGAIKVTTDQIRAFPDGKLPQGWEYIREKASTRVPFTIRGEGETHVPLNQMIPDVTDLHGSALSEGFSTTDIAKAHPAPNGGGYYIVPRATVKAATGEFTRSNEFVRNFIDRPLKVWRGIVLGLRVGFLTNNLVGNSLMYAVKTGGQGALRDLFGAIVETHGLGVAKRIADDPATPAALRADLYREFFPEQTGGTFGLTQSPSTALDTAANAWTTATGAIPRLTSKIAEEYPRRALVRHYIRHSPEFKRVYQSMPKQARTFEAAARQVIEGKGGKNFQRTVSKQVNHALGDYLHLSHMERTVLRNALPFYAWYRAIVSTTFHLAVDTPLRANALVHIGQIGKEWSDEMLGDVPHFLAGAIPLGEGKGGTKRVLGTQGLNPWSTLPQLGVGATSDLTSLGINPFPIAALQAYAEAAYTQHTPRPHISPGELAWKTLRGVGVSLPPAQLVSPLPPSQLYPNRNRTSTFLGQLGVPIKEINPQVAAQQKAQGR